MPLEVGRFLEQCFESSKVYFPLAMTEEQPLFEDILLRGLIFPHNNLAEVYLFLELTNT